MFGYKVRGNKYCFDPESPEPYRISRTKIDLFHECPRCFYLSERLGIGRPSTPPFSLNAAVDELMKREFDVHRAKQTPHPLMTAYGVDAVPFQHKDLDRWRDALRHGVQVHDPATNLILRGGIDDVWISPLGELHVVDYKATSKRSEVNLDAVWQDSYKRQVEVYQWLFRKNGFRVSDVAYFVYVNGRADREAFDGRLEFDLKILPYTGSDAWIEPIVTRLHACLIGERIPAPASSCDYCAYRKVAGEALQAGIVGARKGRVSQKSPKEASPLALF